MEGGKVGNTPHFSHMTHTDYTHFNDQLKMQNKSLSLDLFYTQNIHKKFSWSLTFFLLWKLVEKQNLDTTVSGMQKSSQGIVSFCLNEDRIYIFKWKIPNH